MLRFNNRVSLPGAVFKQHLFTNACGIKKITHALNMSDQVAPQVGLEPTTLRLTAECSAIELLRNIWNAAATYSPGPSPAKYHRRAEA